MFVIKLRFFNKMDLFRETDTERDDDELNENETDVLCFLQL
jgi:hypothetical protein